jgi:hypothetical protein
MNLKLIEIFVRVVVNKNQKHLDQPMLGTTSICGGFHRARFR